MSHLRFVYECRRLWKNAELTPGQVQEKSLRAFHRTLDYAWRKTRFYPDYWKRHGIEYGDLKFIKPEEIPFIKKEDVRNHLEEIATSLLQKVEETRILFHIHFLYIAPAAPESRCNFYMEKMLWRQLKQILFV